MVQLTREQRAFITKTCYETESVNVVAILPKLFREIFIKLRQAGTPITIGVSQLLWAHITTFPAGGNRSARRGPTTFGRAKTYSFHMRTEFESHSGMNSIKEFIFFGSVIPGP